MKLQADLNVATIGREAVDMFSRGRRGSAEADYVEAAQQRESPGREFGDIVHDS